jgi:hypothetical protein
VSPLTVPYLIAFGTPPILLGFTWWAWFHSPRIQQPKWGMILFFSGLCSATANIVLFWGWVVWLRFHYNPESWRVQDRVSNLGLCLLLFAIIAAVGGTGRHRLLLGISGVVALLPWIPIGVL